MSIQGAGCWPGQAQGTVCWVEPSAAPPGEGAASGEAADRVTEILRWRKALRAAAADLDRWCDQQETLQGRLVLLAHREALTEPAWSQETCAQIERSGLRAGQAARCAADRLAGVMVRSNLAERAALLHAVADWLSERLEDGQQGLSRYARDAIVAADRLSVPQLLDCGRPVLLAGPEPPVTAPGPVVWGVPDLGPDWHGRRIAISDTAILLDIPDPRWWSYENGRLRGYDVIDPSGNRELILAALDPATDRDRPLVIGISRLDDLAAVPAMGKCPVAAIALDLDRLAEGVDLHHPGFMALQAAALASAAKSNIPILAGGDRVRLDPEYWLSLGYTALY